MDDGGAFYKESMHPITLSGKLFIIIIEFVAVVFGLKIYELQHSFYSCINLYDVTIA